METVNIKIADCAEVVGAIKSTRYSCIREETAVYNRGDTLVTPSHPEIVPGEVEFYIEINQESCSGGPSMWPEVITLETDLAVTTFYGCRIQDKILHTPYNIERLKELLAMGRNVGQMEYKVEFLSYTIQKKPQKKKPLLIDLKLDIAKLRRIQKKLRRKGKPITKKSWRNHKRLQIKKLGRACSKCFSSADHSANVADIGKNFNKHLTKYTLEKRLNR